LLAEFYEGADVIFDASNIIDFHVAEFALAGIGEVPCHAEDIDSYFNLFGLTKQLRAK
jgi:hypothetical protein